MQETRVMMVTPLQAMEWLKNNGNNRRIRHSVVERYAAAMAAGEWPLTHQGIALGEDGRLLDGQHRLLALKKSGMTLPMSVTFSVPPSAYPYFDVGIKRAMEDGLQENRRHVQIVSCLIRLVIGSNGLTPRMVRQAISGVAGWLLKMDEVGIGNQVRLISSAPARAAVIMAAVLGEKNPDYPFHLYHELAVGNTGNLPSIASLFVKKLLVGELTRVDHGTGFQRGVFFKALPVFQEKNKHLKRLKEFSDSERSLVLEKIQQTLGL